MKTFIKFVLIIVVPIALVVWLVGKVDWLQYAVKSPYATQTNRLIEKTGGVNRRDEHGNTPLHFAAQYDNPQVAEFLMLSRADIDAVNTAGDTPLHFAARANALAVATLLIEDGAYINPTSARDSTPLHAAATGNAFAIAELLIFHGADLDAKNADGFAPLHLAVMSGAAPTAELLIESGANVNVRSRNSDDNTPLEMARQAKKWKMVKILEAAQ